MINYNLIIPEINYWWWLMMMMMNYLFLLLSFPLRDCFKVFPGCMSFSSIGKQLVYKHKAVCLVFDVGQLWRFCEAIICDATPDRWQNGVIHWTYIVYYSRCFEIRLYRVSLYCIAPSDVGNTICRLWLHTDCVVCSLAIDKFIGT